MARHNLAAAQIAMHNGNHERALEHFRRALADAPEDARTHALLSICLGALDRRYGAMEEAQAALRLDPQLPLARIAFGHAVLRAGDAAEARRSVEAALRLDPDNEQALWLACEIALAERRPAALRAAAEAYLARAPEGAEAKQYLSRAASLEGDGPAAEALAREALAEDPESAPAHEALGWAFLAQGRAVEAREAALAALRIAPDGAATVLLAAATLRARPLTGWLFWPGLKMLRLSDAWLFAFLITLLSVKVIADDFLHYLEKPALLLASDVVYWGLLLSVFAFNVAVRAMLARDLGRVRLERGF